MALKETRVLLTNEDGKGSYWLLRFFSNKLTFTEESTGEVITVALATSVKGDNNGDQNATTVPLDSTWGLSANNLQEAALELSGSVGAISLCSYVLRIADPMMPNATVLSELPTGILRNTAETGEVVIAEPEDFPTLDQDTEGNAATATKLQTARSINGQAFDGTEDITIPATASDVYSWAKASTKPSYTASEVGLGNVTNESKTTMLNDSTLTGITTLSNIKLAALHTAPVSATAAGVANEIRFDANYIYLCVATNTWKRSPLTTW